MSYRDLRKIQYVYSFVEDEYMKKRYSLEALRDNYRDHERQRIASGIVGTFITASAVNEADGNLMLQVEDESDGGEASVLLISKEIVEKNRESVGKLVERTVGGSRVRFRAEYEPSIEHGNKVLRLKRFVA